MGTTPKGYPYPEGTDLVMDGDDAIQALAEAIDAKVPYSVASGLNSVPVARGNTTGQVTLTFPTGQFTAVPTVVAGANSSYYNVSASSIGTSSCLLTVRHINQAEASQAMSVYASWSAIQRAAAAVAVATVAAVAAVEDAAVTCPTDGCTNQGIAISIPSTYTDDDGATQPVGTVACGVCGTDITDTLTPLEGSEKP